jgi:ketosteroid isomerase-like protein
VVAREHVEQVVARYCTAESTKDRDTWLSLFTSDATVEEADGSRIQGVDAMRAFFDASVARLDIDLHETAPPIVVGDEALAFLEIHLGRGAERHTLAPIVDHFVFDGEGLIASVRAFYDVAGAQPDPA